MIKWENNNTDRYYQEINDIINSRGKHGLLGDDIQLHHIIPKCKGGLGDRVNRTFRANSIHENCIYVTKEEHYNLHKILYEDNVMDHQLAKAFLMMSSNLSVSAEEFSKIKYHHSDETKKKLSELKLGELNPQYGKPAWNKGIPCSESTRKILSEKLSGENNANYNKHRSDETKDKISKNSRGKKPNMKKVICIETNKIYNSMAEAIRDTGASKIRDVVHGRRATAGGYHWRFYNDGSIC